MANSDINPVFSVVIPVKDRQRELDEALQSIANQEKTVNIQVIVVDDSFPPLNIIDLPSNISVVHILPEKKEGSVKEIAPIPHARNRGLTIAKGKYINFLDVDDKWTEDFVKSSLIDFNKHSQSGGILYLSNRLYEKGFTFSTKQKVRALNLIKDGFLFWAALVDKSLKPTSVFLAQISHLVFKRETLLPYTFDETFYFCEDWKFLFNYTKSHSILIIPKRNIKFRFSPSSNTFTTQKFLNKRKDYNRFIESVGDSGNDTYWKVFKFYNRYLLIDKN